MIKLLFVEDNVTLCNLAKKVLQGLKGEYEVEIAYNGEEGLEKWRKFQPDIIVSDVIMPVMNGHEMVNLIRKVDKHIPILLTSEQISGNNVVDGFKLGVNNYVKKPFDFEELDSYIKATLKPDSKETYNGVYNIGCYTFYFDTSTLHNNLTKKNIILTEMEAGILRLLIENKGKVVELKAILLYFWQGSDEYYSTNSLYVRISVIRKYLKDDPTLDIRAVRSVGYKLVEINKEQLLSD